jgi:catechol 2,3-dioxygenase-like lactoylglutathione lyase family enzyme
LKGKTVLSDFDFWPTLPAADIQRAQTFYREKLGLTPVKVTKEWLTYRTGGSVFQIYPTQFAGIAQHTLGGFVVDDIERVVGELRDGGVAFEEYDLPGLKTVNGIADLSGVERAAWFKDSEGNILSISQFLTDATGS